MYGRWWVDKKEEVVAASLVGLLTDHCFQKLQGELAASELCTVHKG